jgi:4-amino-4-deoxy-L-arabinose transferase-like glycosyltransferase
LAAVLLWVLFFHGLGRRGLWSSHEARAAQDAQTIRDDGAWGLPRLFDGRPELQKPPLYYWCVAAIATSTGRPVDALSVRLPATLSAVGSVTTVFLLCWLRGRPIAGLVAAGVLASAVHFTWLARIGRVDMPLAWMTTLAVSGAYLALHPGGRMARNGGLAVAYVALGGGLLLKGPVALALAVAIVGLHALVEGQLVAPLRLARKLGLWWGVPLTAALALPWYLWADRQTAGEVFRVFLWHHNLERFSGGSTVLASHPWYQYVPYFLGDLLPWSLLFPVAAWSLGRGGAWREDPEGRLGVVWTVAVVGLLSLSAFKRADYLLPAYPGVALLLGSLGERWWKQARHPRWLAAGFAGILIACAVGWVWRVEIGLPRQEGGRDSQPFARAIRELAPVPEEVAFFQTESHPLAFHVGRPLSVFVEWDRLDAWAAQPGRFVVMPVAAAGEQAACLHLARLEEVLREQDLNGIERDRPLVLLRSLPPSEGTDAGRPGTTADRVSADQRAASGPR